MSGFLWLILSAIVKLFHFVIGLIVVGSIAREGADETTLWIGENFARSFPKLVDEDFFAARDELDNTTAIEKTLEFAEGFVEAFDALCGREDIENEDDGDDDGERIAPR